MVNGNWLTILLLDNLKPTLLVSKIKRRGFNVVFALDDLCMYPEVEEEKGEGGPPYGYAEMKPNDEYNEHHAAENSLQMLDVLEPDLVLLGYHQGEGLKKAIMFGKNKKAITVVLLNEPLPPEEEHAAKEAGFSRFCLRRNLLSQIPVFIDQILENRKKKSMTELKRLEEEDAKRNARRLSPMGE